MKKIILAAAMLLLTISLSAQKIGVLAGFNSTQISYENFDASNIQSFHAGLTMSQPLALGFVIQPSLIYNVKGSINDITGLKGIVGTDLLGSVVSDMKTRVQYLEVPVQLQWGIDLLLARPYLFAEPFVGYALGGDYSYTLLSNAMEGKLDMDEMKSRLEYGFGLGAGVEVLGKIQLNLKYFWNFENPEGLSGYLDAVQNSVKDRSSFSGMALSAVLFF